MIQFVCDSCGRVKKSSEAWIIAMAAEAIGVTVARREITIESWDEATAVHPLAVHFCSVKCEGTYMAELFAPDSAAEERGIERTAETVVERRGPAVQRVVTKVKRRSPRPKKRAA